jgi:acyl-coenzyme A thioesterase PaaI-like protein
MKPLSGTLPWTKSCFVCGEDNPRGLRLRSRVEDGRVRLNYRTRMSDVGYRHIVHGGIAATLLDEVMTWAAILETERICVAAEFSVRLKAPLEVEQHILAEAWITRGSSRICYVESHILADNSTVLLKGSGKYMPMPGEQVALCDKDFVHSPEAIAPADLFPQA